MLTIIVHDYRAEPESRSIGSDDISDLLQSLHYQDLEIGRDNEQLVVSGTARRLTLTLIVGESQRIYDMVGDESAKGEDETVIGGQVVPWPRRLLVPLEAAQAAVAAFIGGQAINPADWVEQGPDWPGASG